MKYKITVIASVFCEAISKIALSLALLAMTLFFMSSLVSAEQSTGFAVVELFTSEGCSSCPPADKILMDLKEQAEKDGQPVYVLGFHVDYWNNLGWPDRFSKAEYSDRQREYTQKLENSSVYTPQVIVNGQEGFGGYEKKRLQETVQKFLGQPSGSSIKLDVKQDGDSFLVSYQLTGFQQGDLLQIAVVEGHLQSDVTRGENKGKILKHPNVVRYLQTITVKDADARVGVLIDPQWGKNNLSVMAFLQNPRNFHISAAAFIDLKL